MRQIHPVGFHEKFVASGVYTYYEHGNPRDIHEYWTIHELPDGAQLIRVDLDWIEWGLLIEGWKSPGKPYARIERLDFHLLANRNVAVEGGKASYIFEAESVQIAYSVADEMRQHKECVLQSDYVVTVPASAVFLGFTIAEVSKTTDEHITVVGCCPTFGNHMPGQVNFDVITFQAHPQAREQHTVTIAEKTVKAFRCLDDGNPGQWERFYGPTADWIDEHDVLLRHESQIGDPIILLTQYARRPDPPQP